MIAVALCAGLAVKRMSVDIFPQLGDPAIYVAQPYGGMDPQQMEGFLTYYYEYHFLYITGIEHVESKSIQGAALMKLVFHEGVDMNQAMAQTVGYVNRARAFMPPGAVPPFITRFDAGSVPVGQLVFSSAIRSPGEMQDFALNRVRPLFATLPGVSAPPPFGGNQRTIVVRLDPDKLRQYQISPEEAIGAVNKATLVMPSGVVRTGDLTRIARTNATLGGNLPELLTAPVRAKSGTTVTLGDIGTIENGTDILTAYAHVDGRRTVYIPVTKRADASTLAVLHRVKAEIPNFKKAVPEDVDIRLEFDQSRYVTNAIRGLLIEGTLGAVLTGLMVLIVLRDWRSSAIVVTTIPFALLSAVVMLWAAGQTINVMTLGGLALAVGVLVDEATVEIENIHTQMWPRISHARAVMEACSRTAIPRLLSMFSILAVFVPALFMTGVGKQLFVPLSLAVGFAMMSSYVLSSTLVPVLAVWFMKEKRPEEDREGIFRRAYRGFLRFTVAWRRPLVGVYLSVTLLFLFVFAPRIGTEIFPELNAPLFQLRLRAPTGTRIERTEPMTLAALDIIKQVAGEGNVLISTDYVGVQPASYPINTVYLWTSGPEEAVIRVSLRPDSPLRGEALQEKVRAALHDNLPEMRVSFEAGDIVTQVMSFGSPTPIEVAIQGASMEANEMHAERIRVELNKLRFLRDLQYAQAQDYPTLDVTIDRERAGQFGLTMADVSKSLVAATSSSRFVEPNYWRDPVSGNAFQIQVEIPQNRIQSIQDVSALPVMAPGQSQPLLGDVATLKNGTMAGLIERYNGQRVLSLTANLHGRPLGTAAGDIERAIARAGEPPRGVTVKMRGQIPPLEQTIGGLRLGLLLAIATIFLLLAANFQSFALSLAILLTLPAVLCGVLSMLLITGTTLNVQSFMGAIMAIGIAVANSILLVTFAERSRVAGADPREAAREGALSRVRAILITASAMMAGMLPMALGLGESGAQSAPLGRAVIGGLLLSTVATLTILPSLYAILRGRPGAASPSLNPHDPTSRYYEAL